jgi:hypothetical protein
MVSAADDFCDEDEITAKALVIDLTRLKHSSLQPSLSWK